MTDRPLTDREQGIINAFESVQSGAGARAERNIRNGNAAEWVDVIVDMNGKASRSLKVFFTHSRIYRRMGG